MIFLFFAPNRTDTMLWWKYYESFNRNWCYIIV